MRLFACNECDEPYESFGDCSGICESCRDRLAEQMARDEEDEE